MTAPQLSKAWTITPNLRRAFVSLVDTASWCMYQNKVALVARGWTTVYSCNGVAGPADANDHTDRMTSEAAFGVRSAVAAGAQSFWIGENADGVQIMFAYLGATDDVFRISFSPGGLFTLASPTTHLPTASDEMVVSSGNSIVNATTSMARVMSIWASNDTRHWSFIIFRNNALLNYIAIERINNLCFPATIFGDGTNEIPYVGVRNTVLDRTGALGRILDTRSNTALGAAGWVGQAARVFTNGASRINQIGGGRLFGPQNNGTVNGGGPLSITTTFTANVPALQGGVGGGSPLLPIYWFGERVANLDGLLGYPIDWWQMYTNSETVPSLNDFVPGYDPGDTPGVSPLRTNWLIALGAACVRPWRNAAALLETI
jgi:hypothetical protein